MKRSILLPALATAAVLAGCAGKASVKTGTESAGVWSGAVDISWYSDAADTFTVNTAEELAGLAAIVSGAAEGPGPDDFEGKVILLGRDIMLNDTANWRDWGNNPPAHRWARIGTDENRFGGTFEGNGHTVSGVYIKDREDDQGLFGVTDNGGAIKSLRIAAAHVEGGNYAGILAGGNAADITECYVYGTVTGDSIAGGLVGVNDGTIKSSYAGGSVAGRISVGGFMGASRNGAVAGCHSAASVRGDSVAGGFAGVHLGGVTSGNLSVGKVDGGGSDISGFLGRSYGGVMRNNYYDANASGQSDSGKGSGKTAAEMRGAKLLDSLNAIASVLSINGWIRGSGGHPKIGSKAAGGANMGAFFASGSGSAGEPYVITEKEHLENFSMFVNLGVRFAGRYVKLGRSIALNDTAGWQDWANNPPACVWIPTGSNAAYSFDGVFDGAGHTVSGVYVNHPGDGAGLFGVVAKGAAVRNLGVTASYIRGGNTVGGLAGYNAGTLINCYSNANVAADRIAAGGLVGYNNRGAVTGCYAAGNVSALAFAGGLAGSNANGGAISDCYSTGAVSATVAPGGLTGALQTRAAIRNCYTISTVTLLAQEGEPERGAKGWEKFGLVGKNEDEMSNTITASFFDARTVDTQNVRWPGKTTDNMKRKKTYKGWDFGRVWGIDRAVNNGYPYLIGKLDESEIENAAVPAAPDSAGRPPMRVHPSVTGLSEIDPSNSCYRLDDAKRVYVIDSSGSVTTGYSLRRSRSSRSLETGDGVLIGIDRGEWGGGLYFRGKDDDSYDIGSVGNVQALLRYNGGIYALSGLAHLSMDDGGLHRLGLVDGRWKVTFAANLGSCPEDYEIIGNKLYISTNDGLAEFDGDTLRHLIGEPSRWYGASSIFINEKIIAAGTHGFLTIYDRKTNRAKSYRQVIDPANAQAYKARAAEHLCKRDIDAALADFGAAIKLEPDSADTYILRGDAFHNNGSYSRAISDYSKAIRLQPGVAGTHLMRGISRMSGDRYNPAIEDFNRALEIEPDYRLAYYYRGMTFVKKNDFDMAIADLDRAIRADSADDYAYYGRGWAYLNKGDTTSAVADFETMLKINPRHQASSQVWRIIERVRKDSGEQCPPAAAGTIVDTRDCKKYRTVKISGTTWMAENLNHKIGGSLCYDNDESNCQKYGRLYDWDAAMRACPAGWRLPDTADWNNLLRAAGGMYIKNTHGGAHYWPGAGKILKSKTGWRAYDEYPHRYSDRFDIDSDGTDLFGFSALPGGSRGSDPRSGFGSMGEGGSWWSATEDDDKDAYYRNIYYMRSRVGDRRGGKNYRFSVRCVQAKEDPDIPSTPPEGPIPKGIMWRCNDDTSGTAVSVTATLTKEGTLIIGGKGAVESCAGSRYYGFGIKFAALVIEDGITAIGKEAFVDYDYRDLTSVTIGKNVKSIGENAFRRNNSLTAVTVLNPVPPKTTDGAFGKFSPDACLYVPKGSIGTYRAAAGWKEFKCIEAVESAPKIKIE